MTAALLLQIALKASIVLAAAWVLTRAMTRFSAGARPTGSPGDAGGTAVRPRVESGHTAFVSSRSSTRGRGSTNRTCFGYASDRERGRRCYRRRACERYAADAGGGCCIDPAPVAAPQRPRGGTRLGHNASLDMGYRDTARAPAACRRPRVGRVAHSPGAAHRRPRLA